MKKCIIIVVLYLLYLPLVSAQDECAPFPSPERDQLATLLAKASEYKTPEDFLKDLPASMKANYVFVSDSKSFQTGTATMPRVVMMSSDGTTRISFSLAQKLRGGNNIEISSYNPSSKSFEYNEIAFAPGKPTKAHFNPVACSLCHGNPETPNWDAGPVRAGVIPSQQDQVQNDGKESAVYLSYLEQMKPDSSSRLRFLTPVKTASEVREELTSKGVSSIPFINKDGTKDAVGPAQKMFQNLSLQNRCVQKERLKQKSSFNNIKYLLYGLDAGKCNLTEFVPPWFKQMAVSYFAGITNTVTGLDFKDLEDAVKKDIQARQKSYKEQINGRQNVLYAELGGSLEVVESRKSASESNVDDIAPYRLFLEPMGIAVSTFSPAIDGMSYTFGDQFKNDYLDFDTKKAIESEAGGKVSCDWLKNRSLEAFENLAEKDEITQQASDICNEHNDVIKKIDELKSQADFAMSLIRKQTGKILQRRCAGCHSLIGNAKQTVAGAPVMPFNDIVVLEKLLKSREGQLKDISGSISDRINRHVSLPGSMPVPEVSELPVDEKAYINLWLDSLK